MVNCYWISQFYHKSVRSCSVLAKKKPDFMRAVAFRKRLGVIIDREESEMSIVDQLLVYMKKHDKKILMTTDMQISTCELNVVVIKVLSWLKLEHKRSIWIAEGKKNCLKPLTVNIKYPWCANLYKLVEREKLFHDNFSIRGGKFDFSDRVSEDEKNSKEKSLSKL